MSEDHPKWALFGTDILISYLGIYSEYPNILELVLLEDHPFFNLSMAAGPMEVDSAGLRPLVWGTAEILRNLHFAVGPALGVTHN